MRIVYIGTVELSAGMLNKAIDIKADIVGVITKKEPGLNSDYADLSGIAKRYDIPYRYEDDVNRRDCLEWIRSLRPDIIFCFGFSQILKRDILNIPSRGVIGYHPALLPQNRGRHPIIWALALGLEKTGSTFFFMDEHPDSGNIVDQEEVPISYEDNARSLYDKLAKITEGQIERLCMKLRDGKFRGAAQDDARANYWRRRYKRDGEIDFRMGKKDIYNLVRALSRPYVGAHLIYNASEIKVWSAREAQYEASNVEYGKVLDADKNGVLVKCHDGAVLLTEHEFEKLPKIGDYLCQTK